MDLPRQYPYNPQWSVIILLLAIAACTFCLAVVHASFWIYAPIGAFLMLGGLGLALRRVVFPRFLELGQDAILLPSGFMRARNTKIAYADIEWLQEFGSARTASLKLRAKNQTFEIVSTMIEDATEYASVRNFLNSLPGLKEAEVSRQNRPIERGKYRFQCSYEGNGAIYNSKGEIVWHVKTRHFNKRPRYPYGFFRLPDFVVYDQADKELLRVRRERSFPAAKFVMLEDGVPVCKITQRSILLNKYRLDFAGQSKWTFDMPLFTVMFRGKSDTGARIQVRLRTHNIWYVLIDAYADNPRLVAALAFIHRERLRSN